MRYLAHDMNYGILRGLAVSAVIRKQRPKQRQPRQDVDNLYVVDASFMPLQWRSQPESDNRRERLKTATRR